MQLPAINSYAALGLALGVVGLLLTTVFSMVNTRNVLHRLRSQHASRFGQVSVASLFKRAPPGGPDLVGLLNSKDPAPLDDPALAKLCKRHRRLNAVGILFFLIGAISLMAVAVAMG